MRKAVYPRAVLREVRKGRRVTRGLEAFRPPALGNNSNKDLVCGGGVARQNKDDAVLRPRYSCTLCMPPLAGFHVKPIRNIPIKETRLVHICRNNLQVGPQKKASLKKET